MFDFLIAGIEAPIFLLVLTGMTVGMVGGFIGVGGGYMVTPALIVFGFPGYMASGIDMTHIAGKSVVATVRHRQLGNIDWVLGLAMVGGTMFGVEQGVRLLGYTKKLGLSGIILLAASVVIMIGLFVYTQLETQKSTKKIGELEKDGRKVGRELSVSKGPRL
ncbi:MAG: sulfite exporter TauE/SafE family protein, partial [Desulfobacteria bacterium]